jgi:glycosyltransferase involved in cell wall biosynthesis
MKILLALPRPLFPADTGGKIRTLGIFGRLARRHDVHAVSFVDPERDADAIARMRELFAGYTPVPWRETRTFSPAFYLDFARSRFSRYPYFLEKYRRPSYRAAVGALLSRGAFDLLLCDFLHTAAALEEVAFRPRVLFQHNVEYVIRRRHAEREGNSLKRHLLETEWKKARDAEAALCRGFDRVVVVSEEDRETLQREFAVTNVSAIPTGVDLDYFRPGAAAVLPGTIVFVGSMDWHPNEEGILWFLEQVYPEIRRAQPFASLTLVGRNPSDRIRSAAGRHPAVELTGAVPDVRPYLERAAAVVVPLRIGGGTRIKIFEAMAMGKAVVSTRIGAEGLPVSDGHDILLADEPQTLARSVVSLLEDGGLREKIGAAARERVERDHSWEKVALRMAEILESAIGGPSTRTSPATEHHAAIVSR